MDWVPCYDQLPTSQEMVWGWTGEDAIKGYPFIVDEDKKIVILAIDSQNWCYIMHWMSIDPPETKSALEKDILPVKPSDIYQEDFPKNKEKKKKKHKDKK